MAGHRITDVDGSARTATCSVCGPGARVIGNGRDRQGRPRYRCRTASVHSKARADMRGMWHGVGPGATHDEYLGAATPRPTHKASDDGRIIADLASAGLHVRTKEAPVDGPGWDPVEVESYRPGIAHRAPLALVEGRDPESRRRRSTGELVVGAVASPTEAQTVEAVLAARVAAGSARSCGYFFRAVDRAARSTIAGCRPGSVLWNARWVDGTGWVQV